MINIIWLYKIKFQLEKFIFLLKNMTPNQVKYMAEQHVEKAKIMQARVKKQKALRQLNYMWHDIAWRRCWLLWWFHFRLYSNHYYRIIHDINIAIYRLNNWINCWNRCEISCEFLLRLHLWTIFACWDWIGILIWYNNESWLHDNQCSMISIISAKSNKYICDLFWTNYILQFMYVNL